VVNGGEAQLITVRTCSVEDTKAMAAALATVARPGDLILLAGDMGAGKTAFAQGFAAGLGVLDTVTSPTFTLVHTYDGRYRVHHADLYRLERLAEVADLALGELLEDDDAVVLVEWGDVVAGSLGPELMTVRLDAPDVEEPDTRIVTVSASGGRWAARWPRIQSVLVSWVVSG
jgi:tRNA threonylcarbamoyladenosine biosynthesis protein TsaE